MVEQLRNVDGFIMRPTVMDDNGLQQFPVFFVYFFAIFVQKLLTPERKKELLIVSAVSPIRRRLQWARVRAAAGIGARFKAVSDRVFCIQSDLHSVCTLLHSVCISYCRLQ